MNNVSNLAISSSYFVAGAKGIYAAGTGSTANTFSNLTFRSHFDSLIYLSANIAGCRVQNVTFGTCSCAFPVVYGTGNYVNELHGIGGNFNSDFDSRRELYGYLNWMPGSIPSFGVGTTKLTITGARLGDQIAVGVPYQIPALVYPFGQVVSNDTVQLNLANLSPAGISIGTGIWKARLFN